jgi:hypothetical protein
MNFRTEIAFAPLPLASRFNAKFLGNFREKKHYQPPLPLHGKNSSTDWLAFRRSNDSVSSNPSKS